MSLHLLASPLPSTRGQILDDSWIECGKKRFYYFYGLLDFEEGGVEAGYVGLELGLVVGFLGG
jgi:hypothetical protein